MAAGGCSIRFPFNSLKRMREFNQLNKQRLAAGRRGVYLGVSTRPLRLSASALAQQAAPILRQQRMFNILPAIILIKFKITIMRYAERFFGFENFARVKSETRHFFGLCKQTQI